MARRQLASGVLRASGAVIMLLGVVHLIATPHILHLLDDMPVGAREFAVGPTLLNHVLVGVLLLPLGLATMTAAAERNLTEPWARRVLIANALTTMALPVSILVFMRRAEYYQAPLFVGAVTLTVAAALLVAWAAWAGTASKV